MKLIIQGLFEDFFSNCARLQSVIRPSFQSLKVLVLRIELITFNAIVW